MTTHRALFVGVEAFGGVKLVSMTRCEMPRRHPVLIENLRLLKRFWVRMEPCTCELHFPIGVDAKKNRLSFGVTAYSQADALQLLDKRCPNILVTHTVKEIHDFKPSIDVVANIDLDAFPPFFAQGSLRHPHVAVGGFWRGIWYPNCLYFEEDHRLDNCD